jgi:hypothetical protein
MDNQRDRPRDLLIRLAVNVEHLTNQVAVAAAEARDRDHKRDTDFAEYRAEIAATLKSQADQIASLRESRSLVYGFAIACGAIGSWLQQSIFHSSVPTK